MLHERYPSLVLTMWNPEEERLFLWMSALKFDNFFHRIAPLISHDKKKEKKEN